MIHTIITCDRCNPQDGTQEIVRPHYPQDDRGYFEGPPAAAADAGWWIAEDTQVCPDCFEK